MESIFKQFRENWLGEVDSAIQEKLEQKEYLFRTLLRPDYSLDLTFSSISGKNKNVTADVVSMDSELPLKQRGSLESYSGEIPKIGMQKYLTERQLSELQILERTGKPEWTLAQKIFDDYKSCVEGAIEKVEFMFHQALSNGIIEITKDKNTGRSIRVDFGVPSANRLGVKTAAWSDTANATPIDDIERVLETAYNDDVVLSYMVMDRGEFNNFKKSTQVREYYAAYVDMSAGNLPALNEAKINEFLQADFGLSIVVINRVFHTEVNGVVTTGKAWEAGNVSFFTNWDNLGDLVWGDLAEKSASVPYKTYSYPEEWLMVSMYRQPAPLREFTESQGLVLPVIHNVDQMYIMDATTVSA